jgi:hypothetical protein
MALIQDLESGLFLDRPPGKPLYDLSTAELIGLAKRAVHGPHPWTPSNRAQPAVSRQIALGPLMWLESEELLRDAEARLLPGGRFVLVCYWSFMECWNVEENRMVWRHQGLERGNIINFATDMVDDGQAVVILLLFGDCTAPGYRKCVIYFLPHRTRFL